MHVQLNVVPKTPSQLAGSPSQSHKNAAQPQVADAPHALGTGSHDSLVELLEQQPLSSGSPAPGHVPPSPGRRHAPPNVVVTTQMWSTAHPPHASDAVDASGANGASTGLAASVKMGPASSNTGPESSGGPPSTATALPTQSQPGPC